MLTSSNVSDKTVESFLCSGVSFTTVTFPQSTESVEDLRTLKFQLMNFKVTPTILCVAESLKMPVLKSATMEI